MQRTGSRPLAMACELGAHLTTSLRLLQEPLRHLPMAVWKALYVTRSGGGLVRLFLQTFYIPEPCE